MALRRRLSMERSTRFNAHCPFCAFTCGSNTPGEAPRVLGAHLRRAHPKTGRSAGHAKNARRAYRVIVDAAGCKTCFGGRTWTVLGPDNVGIGQSFDRKDDADGLAQLLNVVYEQGR